MAKVEKADLLSATLYDCSVAVALLHHVQVQRQCDPTLFPESPTSRSKVITCRITHNEPIQHDLA